MSWCVGGWARQAGPDAPTASIVLAESCLAPACPVQDSCLGVKRGVKTHKRRARNNWYKANIARTEPRAHGNKSP
jgi:hypothetical protein